MLPDRLVLLGRIIGLHGIQGGVKIASYTQPRTQIFNYQPWILKVADKTHEIRGCCGRMQGKSLIAMLPGIADRDQAAGLLDSEIWVARDALPKPSPGEYYWADLEGLAVETPEGISLGQVSHLVATGANDVLVVRDGKRERLIPFVMGSYVKDVDLNTGRLTVDWDPEF